MVDADAVPTLAALYPEREKQTRSSTTQKRTELAEAVRGRTVLLTGAGGSLGRALSHRLAALPVEHLFCLDTSEQGLVHLRDDLPRNANGKIDRRALRDELDDLFTPEATS